MLFSRLNSSNLVSSLAKYKRSPSRRSKSRWEPLPEEKSEKSLERPASFNSGSLNYAGWGHVNDKERKVLIKLPFSFFWEGNYTPVLLTAYLYTQTVSDQGFCCHLVTRRILYIYMYVYLTIYIMFAQHWLKNLIYPGIGIV